MIEAYLQPIPNIWDWYIDIAPYTDRLGDKKFAVDTSTDPNIQYFNRDLNRRKYVNLKDPRVAAALYYMAGQTIPVHGTIAVPILTMEEVAAILTTPVSLAENYALRKAYYPESLV